LSTAPRIAYPEPKQTTARITARTFAFDRNETTYAYFLSINIVAGTRVELVSKDYDSFGLPLPPSRYAFEVTSVSVPFTPGSIYAMPHWD
jgi:hypothetical protein